MPMVSGFLRIVQPGLSPGNELPGMEGPVDPGYGLGQGGSIDNGLPQPPPGVFPPPSPAHPIVPAPPDTPPGAVWPPIGGPPSWGGGRPAQPPPRPDQGLPPSPGRPDQGLPPSPGHPDQGLPPSSGRPDNSLPGAGSSGTFWIVAGIPGVGWRYVCVDPSLKPDNSPPGQQPGIDNSLPGGRPNRPDNTLPTPPARPGNELPETPQPKR